ncbi:MAG TPA: hypothetical protein VNW54_01930 [Granulicella sp.]|jgi:hypothetical protein|nr:hypothetical protein [Granulicella sp.]
MTIDDALKTMARIDDLHDGTEARAELVKVLHERLIADPESFWDEFFSALEVGNPVRTQAERLLRSGAVTPETAIGDLGAILAWDAAAEPSK